MGNFRKVDSLMPEAADGDVYGQHAVALMKKAAQVGYKTAIQEELNHPTWDDPDWCRMIVARGGGQVPVFPEDESVTFRCFRCKDTGFYEVSPQQKFGQGYSTWVRCDPCGWRLWAKAKWLRKQEQEGRKSNTRLSGEFD